MRICSLASNFDMSKIVERGCFSKLSMFSKAFLISSRSLPLRTSPTVINLSGSTPSITLRAETSLWLGP